jgi:hypothetical protein
MPDVNHDEWVVLRAFGVEAAVEVRYDPRSDRVELTQPDGRRVALKWATLRAAVDALAAPCGGACPPGCAGRRDCAAESAPPSSV